LELLPTRELHKTNVGAEKRQIKPETSSMSATHVVVEGTLKPDGSLEEESGRFRRNAAKTPRENP